MDKVQNSLYDKKLQIGEWHPIISAWYFKDWNDFEMKTHQHDRVEIMYVLKGTCVVKIFDEETVLKKGEFIFIDAYVPHDLKVKDVSCRMLNVEFGFENVNKDLPSINKLKMLYPSVDSLIKSGKQYILLKDSDEIYYCLKSLVLELNNSGSAGGFMVESTILQLIAKIARLYKDTQGLAVGESDEYVAKAKSFILTNYDTNISIKDIANIVAIHPVHLQRVFKKHTGITVNEFLTEVRIDKAKMLLSNTDIELIDICDYVGISSRQYFSFIFKKYVGMTPYKYRKNSIKMND